MSWIFIEDKKVLSLWKCFKCDTKAYVKPSEMGKPVCEKCGGDTEYVHTVIDHRDVEQVGEGEDSCSDRNVISGGKGERRQYRRTPQSIRKNKG